MEHFYDTGYNKITVYIEHIDSSVRECYMEHFLESRLREGNIVTMNISFILVYKNVSVI